MYIPSWLIVLAIIMGVYLYLKSRKKENNHSEQPINIEAMWEQAEVDMAGILEKSPLLENHLQDERDMVRAMERDMIRLRERYKHNEQKQKEIVHDWMDYAGSVRKIKFARELLDVNMEDTAYDEYTEDTKEAYIKIQEIGERIEKELGKDSSSKLVHDRLRKQAEIANKILDDDTSKKTKVKK